MPWKSSSSPAAATSKLMGKSKPAATSIRGQISAPIPVADSYGHLSEPKQIHLSQQAAQHDSNIRPRQAQGFDQNHTTNAADNPTPPSQVQSVDQRVTIDETAARNSTTPEVGRRLSKTQKKDAPVRKRSPIRDVIGRLFGRRKKTPSQLTTTSEPAQRSSAPPQPMAKNEKDGPSRGSGASRSVSLPITEFDRALRSHSIGLDDVIAIRSARSSLAAVDQNQPKKRNGGGGGGGSGGGSNSPYTLGARYIGDGKLAGLCPRPASVNDRDLGSSSAILADDGDPDEIGRAITGDAGRLKRRSRSMSAIPRFEAKPEEHQHQQHQGRHRRRRSQEVRELRDSCVYGQDPLSPLSSEFPEDDALAAFDLDLPNPSRPAASEPTTTTTAPGPFMFGSLISEDEAANRQQVDEVTLSSRVNGIENRLHVVEDSVSLLRYKANNPHAHVGWTTGDAALPGGLGIQPSFSYPGTRHPHHSLSMGIAPASTRPSSDHSEAVFTESTSRSDGGNHGSSHTAPQQQQQQQQQHLLLPDDDAAARPISKQTLRGHHHHHSQNQNLPPQRHASSLLSDEQYTSLLGLLETERSARIALEAQVQQLARQLNMLLLARHARRGHHQKASAPLAPVSVFEYDADESESFGGRGGRGVNGGSKGSSPRCSNIWHPQQHGYSLDDSGIDPGMARHASTNHDYNDDDDDDDDDDDGSESASQLYATPSEETHAGAFNMYPAAEPEDGASPRTMSLSSITMSPIPTAVM